MARTKSSARQTLLDSAMVLLAANPGASFVEIAEHAGVGRASLYRHFPNREDLLRALCLEAISVTDKAASHVIAEATSARHSLELLIEALVPLGDQMYFLTRQPMHHDPEVNHNLNRQNAELKMLILAAQQEGSISTAYSADWAVNVFNGLIYSAWFAIKEQGCSKESSVEMVYQTFLHGLGKH